MRFNLKHLDWLFSISSTRLVVVSKSRVELQWPEKGFNSQECSIKTSSLVFPFLKHFNHTLQNTDQMAEILKTIQKT